MPSADPASATNPSPDLAAAPAPAPGKPDRPYRKLPGRMPSLRVGSYGRRRLYLGAHELLQVETVFCVEHYRRFAYADIQAVLLRQTPRGLILSIVMAGLALGFGALAWAASDTLPAMVTFIIVAGLFVFLLLFNLVRGPTCRCQLQTAIGPQPLLSLNRLRPARKALALLAERVEEAQGALPLGEAAALVDERLLRKG